MHLTPDLHPRSPLLVGTLLLLLVLVALFATAPDLASYGLSLGGDAAAPAPPPVPEQATLPEPLAPPSPFAPLLAAR